MPSKSLYKAPSGFFKNLVDNHLFKSSQGGEGVQCKFYIKDKNIFLFDPGPFGFISLVSRGSDVSFTGGPPLSKMVVMFQVNPGPVTVIGFT